MRNCDNQQAFYCYGQIPSWEEYEFDQSKAPVSVDSQEGLIQTEKVSESSEEDDCFDVTDVVEG